MSAVDRRGRTAPARPPQATAIDRPTALWRLERVQQEVPLSRSTIRRMELAGTFPRRVRLSGNCVAWRASDVEAWKASRPEIDST